MPEMIEVETYRQIALRALHRPIREVVATDGWYLKRGVTAKDLDEALTGHQLSEARRIGKLLLLDVDAGGVLALHFGMAGKLLVDGLEGQSDWAYVTHKSLPEWDRFTLRFDDGGELRLNDSRRLGGVELDPVESRLGTDALEISLADLRKELAKSTAPLKARIMDQAHLAGVGNLIADETLWRAGLDPARSANSLDDSDSRMLHRALRSTIKDLMKKGGSHTGDLMEARVRGGACPKDGAPLLRRQVGGRTTYSCPKHQQ